MKIKATLMAVTCCLAAGAAQADVVAGWDVSGTGTSNNTGYLPGTILSGETVSGLGRTGVSYASAGNSFNSNSWNLTTTFDPATAASYISFTISPTVGNQLTLTSLQYAMNGSNTAPRNGVWGYTTNGGANWTLSSVFTVPFTLSASLSSWDFSDFSVSTGTTVQFRFWAYGSGAGNSINGGTPAAGGTIRIGNISGNDLVLNGSLAAVPEPATYGIVIAGALALVVFARRGRQSAASKSA
jgi:hypothetical protein